MTVAQMTAKEMRATNPTKDQLMDAVDYLISIGWSFKAEPHEEPALRRPRRLSLQGVGLLKSLRGPITRPQGRKDRKMYYTITYRKEEADGGYSHTTIGSFSADQLEIYVFHLGDNAYQYYVTEWDNNDEIIESVNADEWLENYRLEDENIPPARAKGRKSAMPFTAMIIQITQSGIWKPQLKRLKKPLKNGKQR